MKVMAMTDDELERYLKGDSALSRKYRGASRETAPPELDDKILALARTAARRKPGLNRVLAPFALAASLILGVNLAWNVYEAAPPVAPAKPAPPAAPEPEKKAVAYNTARKPEGARPEARRQMQARAAEQDRMAAAANDASAARGQLEGGAAAPAPMMAERASPPKAAMSIANEPAAAAPAVAKSEGPVLSETQKIDRLIGFIASLQGAVFIRNGSEYGPQQAADHLRMKLGKAGDRVKTADDFIKLCASHSYVSGEAYLIRFPDGRTRTAEDVLREQLAHMEQR